MMKKAIVALCLIGGSVFSAEVEYNVSKDVPKDTYSIQNQVLVNDTKKIAIDYWPGSYAHYIPANLNNIWNRFGAFEPRILVNWGPVEQGGENSFVCNNGWGLSGWNKWESGFWDGAEVHVFGMKDGQFELKRKSILTESIAGGKSDFAGTGDIIDTYTLEKDGGAALEAGDWVYLKKTLLKPNPNQLITSPKTGQTWGKNGVANFAKQANMINSTAWELVSDPCPEADSTAAMKLTTTGHGGFYEFHTGGTMEGAHKWPEGEFHWEGWLKRSTSGKVKIDMGNGTVSKTFDVGKKWEKFEFDFNPAEAFKNYQAGTSQYSITVPDRCDVYLDNIMIVQKGLEPFATYPEIIEKLKEFKPGMMRLCTVIGTRSVDVLFSKGISQCQEQDASRGGYTAMMSPVTMVAGLEVCRDIGANPWVLVPGMMTLEDCDHVMEYLAGPADAGFGKKRNSHGRSAPWADEFDVIYIEIGNEQWGANFSHCFNRSPKIYGRMADMFIRRMKASPYYTPGKFKFICNAWHQATGRGRWSEQVARSCPSADIFDLAYYFGGWDGVTLKGDDDTALFQSRMFYTPHIVEKSFTKVLCVDQELGPRMAKILENKPELQSGVFPYLTGGGAADLTADSQKILSAIMAVPANAISGILFRDSEESRQLIKKIIGLKPDDEVGIKLESIFYLNPAPLNQLIGQYPNEFIAFADQYNLIDAVKEAIKTLGRGEKPGRIWVAYNHIIPAIKRAMNTEYQTNPVLIADVTQAVDKLNIFQLKEKLVKQTVALFDKLVQPTAADIFAKIQSSPDRMLAEMVNNPEVFTAEAEAMAQQIAAVLSREQAAYNSDEFDLNKIDAGNRVLIFDKLLDTLDRDQISLDQSALALVTALTQALATGDTAGIDQLEKNPTFIAGLQKRLLNLFGDKVVEAMIADKQIAEAIFKEYDELPKDPASGNKEIANYEAGPGYMLPGPNVPVSEESEAFGKSLALGITTLDTFMYEMERGFGYQCFFKFGFGTHWGSHNNNTEWLRHPCYEALLMVNEYCDGDLMAVDNSDVKRVDIPKMKSSHIDNHGKAHHREVEGRKNVSLTKCYAFQTGKKHSILLYNRSFTDSRTVKLNLPYSPNSKAVLHKLSAASPKDTNRKELMVQQTRTVISNFADGYELILTPAEIVIIVNEEK